MKNKLFAVAVFAVLAALTPASAQNNTFKLASTQVGVGNPSQVIATDINGDGKMDLICADTVLTNNGKGVFSKAFSLPANFRTSGWVTADVNRDGKVDLITLTNLQTSPYTESIVVYTNSGPTGFSGSFSFGVSSSTTNVGNATATLVNGTEEQGNGSLSSAGDVYGNGRANLFYYNSISNSLSLYTNNGSGVFGSNTTFGVKLSLPAVADVNRDGSVDFVGPNYSNNIVYVFTNNGSGVYASNASFKVKSPVNVVAADVNGDGWVDLIVQSVTNNLSGQYTNTISIWTNNQSGVFGSNTSFTVGGTSQRVMDVKAAQVFGDGQLDLVFAVSDLINNSVNTLMVYTNNGFGGFGSNTTMSVGSGFQPASVAVADVNGDGPLDLISANNSTDGGNLTVFTNTGSGIQSGSFLSNSMPVLFTNVYGLLAADIYRNGNLDLITVPNTHPASLLVLTNNGSGVFGSNALVSGFVANNNSFVVAPPIMADIFGDGSPALIVGLAINNGSSGNLTVLTNNGSGVFGTNSSISTGSLYPNDISAADVNGDGKLDLIVAGQNQNGSSHYLMVLTNNGSGGFGTNVTLTLNGYPQLVVADVNGDGRPDLITAYNYQNCQMTVFTNISATGSGPLYSSSSPYSTTYQVTSGSGAFPSAMVAADVNGDGKVDFIIANNNNPGTLSVMTNNGVGVFSLASSPVVGAYPHALTAADVNSDGKVDLISANWGLTTNTTTDLRGPLGYGTVTVLTNNGSGLFTNVATFSVGPGPTAVIAADVIGNGKLDIITANTTSFTNENEVSNAFWYGLGGNTLSVLLNTSNFLNTVVLQTAPSDSPITYGQTLSAAGLSGGAATNEAGAAVAGTFAFTTNSVPGAGTPNVQVTFTPTAPTDYQPVTFNVSVTVNQLAAILKGKRAYDGTTNAVYGILSVSNKVGSDNVTVSAGSVGLAAANIGTNSITSTNNLALGGSTAVNYTLSGVSGSVIITQAIPVVTLTSSENPSGYGASVSFTATLPSYATGTIQFQTNGVNFDLEGLSSGSAGSVPTALLPAGTSTIIAAYSGDANDLASSNSLSQVVNLSQFNAIGLGAGGLIMSGSWGVSNVTYSILASTNLSLPISQWTPVLTNQFDNNGNFNITNAISPGLPDVYYILEVP